ACRLAPDYGEAWATLGFVLDRTGRHVDALAASRRAITLEPDNWRHHFRLAYVSWGEERLRESHRTLSLMPAFPLAHWLAATVHVARHALGEAEREVVAGVAAAAVPVSKFSSVALHWLHGLLLMARGEDAAALASFERELALEASGHLYARECCANTWYAIGALHLRHAEIDRAGHAFHQAIQRVPQHRLAFLASRSAAPEITAASSPRPESVDAAFIVAAAFVRSDDYVEAARLVDDALASAPAGNAGWLLPIEPLLQVTAHPEVWASALARLRTRAS